MLPNEINLLSAISKDFLAVGHSAVDVTQDILIGRPFGGTGILFKKSMSEFISNVDTRDPRISAVILNSVYGPILLVSAYMPTDYGDCDSLENYVATCAYITALYQDSDAVQLIVAGDFNCQYGSRFYDVFLKFAEDNRLQLSDLNRLKNVFTYSNDAATSFSWLDHFLCSPDVDQLVSNCKVEYSYVTSDHKPIAITFDNFLPNPKDCTPSVSSFEEDRKFIPDWSKCDECSIARYKYELDVALNNINIPSKLLGSTLESDIPDFKKLIDNYYNEVMSCMIESFNKVIPGKKFKGNMSDYVIPGWNDIVSDKHDAARSAFLQWQCDGKPRQGLSHVLMNRTRAQFKLALRYCKDHEEALRSDALANSLSEKDYSKFWDTVRKTNNSKAANYAHTVDGCSGATAIAERWRSHFENLYNSVIDQKSEMSFHQRISCDTVRESQRCYVSRQDILAACNRQKCGKAVGPDNIAMEAFINSTSKLHVHLSILFNLFITFGYLPMSFTTSLIIPLVKNKCGNLSDLNNYRAISISPAVSKIFETVLEKYVRSDTDSAIENHQFGFKTGHSTSLCTNVLKQTVEYYISRGSYIFTCFLDFQKAFDKVNYWKLFLKLLDNGVNSKIVSILAVWYTNQVCYVRWQNVVSSGFNMCNGTRQGGVLSPYLFTTYIRDLLREVNNTGIGCFIGDQCINILAYADDLVLIAPSWRALQILLNVVHVNSTLIDLSCNASKTVCMTFTPKNRNRVINTVFPLFKFGASDLQFISKFKYLGHIITNEFSDDEDIQREIRSMFVRCNHLIRRFYKCSKCVKLKLFQSFCLCFYDIALWTSFSVSAVTKFRSCYNKCIKLFFGYRKYDSLTGVLLATGLPSFDTILYNARCIFKCKWLSCENTVVQQLVKLHMS